MSARKKTPLISPILGNVYVFRLYVHLGSPLDQEKPLEREIVVLYRKKDKAELCVCLCVCMHLCVF